MVFLVYIGWDNSGTDLFWDCAQSTASYHSTADLRILRGSSLS